MYHLRRTFLKLSGALAAGAAASFLKVGNSLAATWNKSGFESKVTVEALKSLSASAATPSREIAISAPDIAENGAVVPITVTSSLPKTESIAILVEKNPNILTANFTIPAGTDPFVSSRVKMGQTSDVYALVKADGKYYYAKKEIKVTIGGCGG